MDILVLPACSPRARGAKAYATRNLPRVIGYPGPAALFLPGVAPVNFTFPGHPTDCLPSISRFADLGQRIRRTVGEIYIRIF